MMNLVRIVLGVMSALALVATDGVAASIHTALAGDGKTTILIEAHLDDGRVQRPGVELIGGSIFHLNFNSLASGSTLTLLTPSAVAAPPANLRAEMLLGDAGLNTGVLNVAGGAGLAVNSQPIASDLGLGFFFHQQVVNGLGPDMILFDFVDPKSQEADGVHVSALSGLSGYNSFVVGTGAFNGAQFSEVLSIANTARYQETNPISSLTAFETKPLTANNPPVPQNRGVRWLAIDFADLGVEPFGHVDGIFLQSVAGASFDPVLIAGFTPVPEPAAMALGLWAIMALAGISRRTGVEAHAGLARIRALE
jgi:hypothetical protein